MLRFLIRRLDANISSRNLLERCLYNGSLRLLRTLYREVRFQDDNGNTFLLHPCDVIDRHLLLEGVWESHVTQAMRAYLKPGQTVYDVGANFGYNTVLASKLVGSEGRVVSFEPNPRMAARLRRHVRENHCENVEVFEACVTPEPQETLMLYVPPPSLSNPGRASLLPNDSFVPVETRGLQLDALIDDGTVPPPDLVKIDVEGFERQVLQSLAGTLAYGERKMTVLAEITSPCDGDTDETTRTLLAAGFEVADRHRTHEFHRDGIAFEQFDAVFRKLPREARAGDPLPA